MNLETYISEFSKYVIATIMALYCFVNLEIILRKKEPKKSGAYLRQNILMFAFHFSCFMVICFETGEVSYLIFYAFQQIVMYATIMLYKSLYPKSDRLIVNNMCMLLSISFVILTRLEYTKAVKQFIIASASLAIGLIIPFFIRYLKLLKNLKWIYAALGVVALGIVMILGQSTYGSKISYTIAGLSFQPAEFVKIIFVFFVASSLYKATDFFEVFTSAVVAALHVIIQVANKDLGSALIFFVVYLFMLFISTSNIIYLVLGIGAGSGAAYVAYRLFSHVQVRVMAWKDPWSVIDSAGYQITQSLFGITSGGYFGLGLYKGSPNSIPFVEDDFIFSALTEEFGVVFSISMILVCLFTFVAIMKIALSLNDNFYKLIACGLGITYIFQVFLTVGGGTKFIPLTGVTLPLVSYGGTSVLTTIIMFAIIEGLYMIHADEADATKTVKEPLMYSNKNETKKEEKRNSAKQRKKYKDNIKKRAKKKDKKNRPLKKYNTRTKYYDEYDDYKDERNYEYSGEDGEEYDDSGYVDEYEDDEYVDDEYADDEYADDEYVDDEYEDDEYEDDEYEDDEYEDDEYDDENDDNIGEIYYNEEEYERDRRRK